MVHSAVKQFKADKVWCLFAFLRVANHSLFLRSSKLGFHTTAFFTLRKICLFLLDLL